MTTTIASMRCTLECGGRHPKHLLTSGISGYKPQLVLKEKFQLWAASVAGHRGRAYKTGAAATGQLHDTVPYSTSHKHMVAVGVNTVDSESISVISNRQVDDGRRLSSWLVTTSRDK